MAATATVHRMRSFPQSVHHQNTLRHQNPPVRLDELVQEGERLRLEFLRNSLEFTLNLARFSEAKPESLRLRQSCWRAARTGYCRLRDIISKPPFSNMDLSEFLPEFQRLEAMLNELEIGFKKALAKQETPTVESLTPRETQVLRLIAEGCSTKMVAHKLGMSFKTAACHRYRIMDKLGIHDAVTLTHYAVRKGIAPL